MTTTPEQIEAVARAICSEKGDNWEARNFNETGDGTKPEENREAYRHIALVAINAMRPFIRAEVLEEAARICDEADVKEREFFVGADNAIDEVIYDRGSYVARISAAAIRALKEKP